MQQTITLPFNEKGEAKNKKLVLTESKLAVFLPDQTQQWQTSALQECKITPFVGGGALECKINGVWTLVCKFSNTFIEAFGELAKFLNHVIQTKQFDYDAFKGINRCQNCHEVLPNHVSVCPHCSKGTDLWKSFFKLIAPYKKTILLAFIFVSLFSVLRMSTPIVVTSFIDLIVANGGIATNAQIALFVTIAALLLIVALFVDQVAEQTMLRVNTKFSADLKNRCFEQMQNMSLRAFGARDSGEYIGIIQQSTRMLSRLLRGFVLGYGSNLVRLVFITAVMFYYAPTLATLAFLPVPVLVIGMSVFYIRMFQLYKKQNRAIFVESRVVHDLVSGIRVIKAFGKEEQSAQGFKKAANDVCNISKSNEKKWIGIFVVFHTIVILFEGAVLMLAGFWVLDGTLSLGTLLLFIMYMPRFFGYINSISRVLREYQWFKVEISKVLGLLNTPNELVYTTGSEFPAIQGEIEFKNVSFGYNAYDLVLKNISFTIKKGEMLGLVGHSGSGKSTIINLLLRLYDVTSGQILIDGVPIQQIPKSFLQASFGIVFQERYLFHDTVFNNVKYTFPSASHEQVIAACKAANIHSQIASLKHGYETQIGEGGSNLSGGEKQRLVIARAILPNPNILILDEATSALDVESEKAVQEAFATVALNKTTIAIAHRLTTLKHATKLIVLKKGEIVEQGKHEELVNMPNGEYAMLVEAQKNMSLIKSS